ncbi:hypothetical protein [Botrimarina colliarenosi]|uniref:hypothetical protein n=1 Tax=Botrimarina colliarenosi TaxID=2528001 RepID=UPI001E59FFAD|nr:hypothetical protein [Botrimarina colliarenosi]
MTDSIWITRSNTRGLFNAASEGSQGPTSPAGTLWAVGTTADLPSLEFKTWLELIEPGSAINGPPNSVGLDFVVQLVDEQIYLDLRFTSWGEGSSSGGGFSYVRSTAAIPEPATGSIALVALLAISARRGRPTRQL